jgi:CO dehydrogenase/acetyl-CoA synthase gamma subunit (corrinoid Fe-S protein)
VALIELTSSGMKNPVVINTSLIVSYYTQQSGSSRPDVTKINMAAAAEGSATYVLVTESREQLEQLLGQAGETVHRLSS